MEKVCVQDARLSLPSKLAATALRNALPGQSEGEVLPGAHREDEDWKSCGSALADFDCEESGCAQAESLAQSDKVV